MLANLRGVSSSAKLLSLPTHLFMGMIFLLPAIPVASQQALTASVWWCYRYS